MVTRRDFLIGWSSLACGCGLIRSEHESLVSDLKRIRAHTGGRLGVHALDTGTGRRIGLDDASRFAMASTFKLLLAGAILQRCDRGTLQLDQRVSYGAGALVPYAPEASKNLARGFMTIEELCAAILLVSDNAAANLLLAQLGGPSALTRFARELGDAVTRLDRLEPELNTNVPGDLRDTTSPRAMVDTMHALLVGSALAPASRARLIAWMVATETGIHRIRRGLPSGFRAGDKTGTGSNGAVNDLAIAWPPRRRPPLLIAIYMSGSTQSVAALSEAHAEVAQLLASAWP
ncbi:MAG TPA: class A beta-lactamase [Polyangiales bacterium]|nr:class A beta-lactamase [Polyangiales bacterium]